MSLYCETIDNEQQLPRTDEMGTSKTSIQQYCLRWNSHHSNLLLAFEHLFQTEAFTDVTLACEGKSIKCHKMVLAACSPYFQQLFMENTCRHPIVILKDIRESEIRAILEYMYKGEVNVAQDQLAGLLKAAETLKVKGLVVEDNSQRTAPMTPAPTPHPSSSTYHGPSLQQQLQLTALPTSSQHVQDQPKYYYSSSLTGNHDGITSTTSFNVYSNSSNNSTPNNGNGNGNGNGSSSIIASNSSNNSGGNFSIWNNSSGFEPGLMIPNDQPVPLKKKRFMQVSSPSSSSIENKDTPIGPILRTILGHTGGSSSHALSSIAHANKQPLSYPYTTPMNAVAPITTNGPIDTSDQLRLHRERKRESHRERDRDRDQDSPVDFIMDDSARSMDSDGGHDDNHSYGLECDDKKGGLPLYVPSQKPEWKGYKQYTRNDIMAAIDAVREGMSALQAARKFGVPARTLYDKVKKLGITTNRPYRKGSFPMSPNKGMNMKDDNSRYSPEEMPLDISSTGNGLGHMSALEPEGDRYQLEPEDMRSHSA